MTIPRSSFTRIPRNTSSGVERVARTAWSGPGQERSQPRPKTAVETAVQAYRATHKSASENDAIRAVFKENPALYAAHKRDTRYRG